MRCATKPSWWVEKEPNVPLLVLWANQRSVLTSNDAVKRAVKQEMLLIVNRLH